MTSHFLGCLIILCPADFNCLAPFALPCASAALVARSDVRSLADIMLPSSLVPGYRDFSDYALANNPRDFRFWQPKSFRDGDRGLSGSSSGFLQDSDTDSGEDYSDAQSQLGEYQALEARYGRQQILCILNPKPEDALNDAFQMAFECKVLSCLLSLCFASVSVLLTKLLQLISQVCPSRIS